MSSRIAPLVVAIASVGVRMSGDHIAADVLGLAALGAFTIAMQRSAHLQAAATPVPSEEALAGARNRETA